MTKQVLRSFRQELTARWTISESVRAAIIGAIYVALTMALAPLAYGMVQFRIGEMMAMLPYDRKYGARGAVVGMLVGSTIVGVFSPHGAIDLTLGIVGCFITLPLMWWLGIKFKGSDKGKIISGTIFTLIVTFQVGYLMLHLLFGCPLTESLLGVFIGEAVTVIGLGFALLKALERTYKGRTLNVR